MFRKILAMALCALMLGGATAETKVPAWRVTADRIEVEYLGETVALTPTVEAVIGQAGTGCWSEVSVLLDGEAVLTVQGEYVNDTLTASADGANDVLFVNDAEMFFTQYAVDSTKLQAYIAAMFDILAENELPDMEHLKIDFTGKNEADCALTLGDYSLTAHVAWDVWENGVPYDLNEKNVCRYTFREMFPGDGTDIPNVIGAALDALMQDGSVQALKALIPTAEPAAM